MSALSIGIVVVVVLVLAAICIYYLVSTNRNRKLSEMASTNSIAREKENIARAHPEQEAHKQKRHKRKRREQNRERTEQEQNRERTEQEQNREQGRIEQDRTERGETERERLKQKPIEQGPIEQDRIERGETEQERTERERTERERTEREQKRIEQERTEQVEEEREMANLEREIAEEEGHCLEDSLVNYSDLSNSKQKIYKHESCMDAQYYKESISVINKLQKWDIGERASIFGICSSDDTLDRCVENSNDLSDGELVCLDFVKVCFEEDIKAYQQYETLKIIAPGKCDDDVFVIVLVGTEDQARLLFAWGDNTRYRIPKNPPVTFVLSPFTRVVSLKVGDKTMLGAYKLNSTTEGYHLFSDKQRAKVLSVQVDTAKQLVEYQFSTPEQN